MNFKGRNNGEENYERSVDFISKAEALYLAKWILILLAASIIYFYANLARF